MVARSAEADARLQEAAAQLASLNEQTNALAAEKAGLEETLQEKDARIERLTGSITFMQAQLDGTILGKNESESKLRSRETEIDDLEQQIADWESHLESALPAEATPEAAAEEGQPAEAPAPEATAEEGQPAEDASARKAGRPEGGQSRCSGRVP